MRLDDAARVIQSRLNVRFDVDARRSGASGSNNHSAREVSFRDEQGVRWFFDLRITQRGPTTLSLTNEEQLADVPTPNQTYPDFSDDHVELNLFHVPRSNAGPYEDIGDVVRQEVEKLQKIFAAPQLHQSVRNECQNRPIFEVMDRVFDNGLPDELESVVDTADWGKTPSFSESSPEPSGSISP